MVFALASSPDIIIPPMEGGKYFWDYLQQITTPVFEFLQNRIVFLDVDFSLWEFMIGSAIVSLVLYAVFRIME